MKPFSIHFTRQRFFQVLVFSIFISSVTQAADEHDHAAKKEPAAHDDHKDHGHEEYAAKSADQDTHDDHGHEDHADHAARVSPAVLQEFGVVLSKVGPGVLHEEIILPGEIQFNREALAYATPRYNGVLTKINARLADHVEAGQVIATLESTDTLRPFDLKAPIDGTIVNYDVTPGQTVEAGTPLYTIANLSTVWADLRIYQRDMAKIEKGQSVLIDGGHNLKPFRGKIAYIAPTVDEHTRTGLARVIVENHQRDWKPGQFIKGNVAVDEHQAAMIVPRTAVLTHEGAKVVFVQTAEGFEPRPVVLGHSDAQFFEVLSGLKLGETIATKNPISLKAELGKASFGGHEGHAH
ncbi:efflux RND transporter periplasmic adaptor subunit [Cerasicoccus arenae]|nr:efflux RND transporter periplasmic adaptor subunit [Cerasicoccus arenae]MBK1859725.1 efflux RND transporter periplasmic adaptor subunit [Cerasicoccus arenae]